MRIIIVNDNATVSGGATKVALLSAKGLAEAGHEVHFVHGVEGVDPTYAGLPGICWHCVGTPAGPMSAKRLIQLSYLNTTYQLVADLIRQGDPKQTVVHSHIWKTGVSPSFVNAALNTGAHLICTFHDYHVACPQGQFYNPQTNEICTLRPGSFPCLGTKCTHTRTILPKWAEVYRWSVQQGKAGLPTRVKHFGILSQKSLDAFGDYLPKGAKLHMIPNPIQCVQAPRVDITKNRRFIFSGRLSNEKDPAVLMRAAAKIGAEVHFLGDGPLLDELRALNYPKASFSGWIDGEQILREMESARAMAITSRWYEVSPLAPLEALSKGIPVLASDCTATVYDIEEGETGFKFRKGDAADLAEKMDRLLQNEAADRMSKSAYDRFWANPPSVENHVRRLLEVYAEMLAES